MTLNPQALVILSFAALGLSLLPVCLGQDSSLSFSSGDPLLPCVYNGIPLLHGETWKVGHCITCVCDNSTSTCVTESCEHALCVDRIKPEGECCCPSRKHEPEEEEEHEGEMSGIEVETMAQDQNQKDDSQGKPDSFPLSNSSRVPLPRCVFRGISYLHGENWKVDECTTCNCDKATATCVIVSCHPAFCQNPIRPEGECCFICPFNVHVVKVDLDITSNGRISEGRESTLTLRVLVQFRGAMWDTSVYGQGLWKLKAWASRNADGSGRRYGYIDQTLNETQVNQDYNKRRPFVFESVIFQLDDPTAECCDMQYICVKFQKGDNPQTHKRFDFFRGGSALISCTKSPQCQERGVAAVDVDWSIAPFQPLPTKKKQNVNINATVTFRGAYQSMGGWRLGIFASENMDGSGKRFGYISQILSNRQASSLLSAENKVLKITHAVAKLNMQAIGCMRYAFTCVEFEITGSVSRKTSGCSTTGSQPSHETTPLVKCHVQTCHQGYISQND